MHIPIWIVESNCIHNIFMPFKYMELLSWCSVPYFTCSVIASCYKTKAQDEHCHHNSKLIVTTRSNLRLGGAFELFYRSSRARSARSGAPWVKKCGKLPIRENLVITWPYTDRPPDRPSAPQAYQCKIIQSTGMATEMQLKVLFGKKSHGRPDFKKEKTTKSCLFRRYFWCLHSRG